LYHQRSVSGGAVQWPPDGIGIEVAADEAELLHATLELVDAVVRRYAGRLRQLATQPMKFFG